MGRRPASARFMPEVYVFPGGAVEERDYRLKTDRPLPDDVVARLQRQAGEPLAHALGWTAVRETWEETGLMLGAAGVPGGPADCPAVQHYGAAGLMPDLSVLDYLMRAVTPAYIPIRFNTRFFIADGAAVTGTLQPCSELEDVSWRSLEEALTLRIINVTRMVLDAARRYWHAKPEPDPERPTPMFTQSAPGRVVLRDE